MQIVNDSFTGRVEPCLEVFSCVLDSLASDVEDRDLDALIRVTDWVIHLPEVTFVRELEYGPCHSMCLGTKGLHSFTCKLILLIFVQFDYT